MVATLTLSLFIFILFLVIVLLLQRAYKMVNPEDIHKDNISIRAESCARQIMVMLQEFKLSDRANGFQVAYQDPMTDHVNAAGVLIDYMDTLKITLFSGDVKSSLVIDFNHPTYYSNSDAKVKILRSCAKLINSHEAAYLSRDSDNY